MGESRMPRVARAVIQAGLGLAVTLVQWGCGEPDPRDPEPPSTASVQERLTVVDEGLLPPPSAPEQLGVAVAVAGDTAVVGELGFHNGGHGGRVHVYVRSAGRWLLAQTLDEPTVAAQDEFGAAVAFDGTTLAVAARRYGDPGAVFVYTKIGSTWTRQAQLVPPNPIADALIGTYLALEGDTIVAGAFQDADASERAMPGHVFIRQGSTWSHQGKIIPVGDFRDNDVSRAVLSGNTFVMSHPGYARSTVEIFERSGASWMPAQTLQTASGAYRFGASLALQGDVLVVGAPASPDPWGGGRVEVYRRRGGSWHYQEALTARDGTPDDLFGVSLALRGDLLLVGAPWAATSAYSGGAAYLFARSGEHFLERQRLYYPEATQNAHFGMRVALGSGHALVGGPDADGGQVQAFRVALGNGEPCTTGETCASGHCKSGVCCATACAGTCLACSAVDKWAGLDGTCGAARSGVVCGPDTSASTCASPTELSAARCDEARRCVPSVVAPCPGGTTCASGACLAPLGASCAHAGQCTSGHCVDGVCCDTACGGGDADDCRACSVAAGGTCDGRCGARENGLTCDDGIEGTYPDRCTAGACSGPAARCATPCDSGQDPACRCSDQLDPHCNLKDPLPDGAPCGEGGACHNWFCVDAYVPVTVTVDKGVYGSSEVAAYGDRFIAVGGSDARVYRATSPDGSAWAAEPGVLIGAAGEICYGRRFALGSGRALAGCFSGSGVGTGSTVAVFETDGAGTWVKRQDLVPSSPALHPDRALALDGDRAVLIATSSPGAADGGAAIVFEHNGSSLVETAILLSTPTGGDRVHDVAVSGDTIAVGVGEQVEVHVRGTSSWSRQALLTAPVVPGAPRDTHYGEAVALSGDILAVGAPYDGEGRPFSGAVHVYKRTGSTWSPYAKLKPRRPYHQSFLGRRLALDGPRLVASRGDVPLLYTDLGGGKFDEIDLGGRAQSFGLSGAVVASSGGRQVALHILDRPTGAPCGGGGACASFFCSGGVCCDRACDGTCETCRASDGAVADGTCTPRANGSTCDDDDACTTVDSCADGACAGSAPMTCTAGRECTASTCHPRTGECCGASAPEHAPCSSGECRAGACTDVPASFPDAGPIDEPDAGAGGATGTGGAGGATGTGGAGGAAGAPLEGGPDGGLPDAGPSASGGATGTRDSGASGGTGAGGTSTAGAGGGVPPASGGATPAPDSGAGPPAGTGSSDDEGCSTAPAPAPHREVPWTALVALGVMALVRRSRLSPQSPAAARAKQV